MPKWLYFSLGPTSESGLWRIWDSWLKFPLDLLAQLGHWLLVWLNILGLRAARAVLPGSFLGRSQVPKSSKIKCSIPSCTLLWGWRESKKEWFQLYQNKNFCLGQWWDFPIFHIHIMRGLFLGRFSLLLCKCLLFTWGFLKFISLPSHFFQGLRLQEIF